MKIMKKSIVTIFIAILFQSCAFLLSGTIIGPNKTFILGEGNHQAYSVTLENIGSKEVEILTQEKGKALTAIGIIKKNEKSSYNIPENTTVYLRNANKITAVRLKVNLNGNSNLSMNYKGN